MEVPEATVVEETLLPVAVVEGVAAEEHPVPGPAPPGITSFAPSLSLNVFTNIFHVSRMDWMREKLRNLAISPLPIVVSTPSTTAILEEVPQLPLESADVEVGSPTTSPC